MKAPLEGWLDGCSCSYASMGTRALRVDMESAPTSAESFGPEGASESRK